MTTLLFIVVIGLGLWAWTHFTAAGKADLAALEARIAALESSAATSVPAPAAPPAKPAP